MADIILQELNSSDIDWMASVGEQIELTAGQVLLEADRLAEALFIVLDGELELLLPIAKSPRQLIAQSTGQPASQSASQSASQLASDAGEPIGRLTYGDIAGTLLLPEQPPSPYSIRAIGRVLALAIPEARLRQRIQQDRGLEARLFRAIALILARQHSQFVALLQEQNRMPALFVPKSIFSVFSCLQDSDICWMLGAGTVRRLEPNEVCIAEGKPLDALYITLKGSLSISIGSHQHRPLALAFRAFKTQSVSEETVSQVLPGELVGLSQFLDFGQNRYIIRANQDALVLAIPLPILQQKIQQDHGFAARFYRAAASLMAERTEQLFGALHYGERCYECGDSLKTDQIYDDEMEMEELKQTSLARARFSWMLKQLNIKE
jgi:CRP-like cAMP-binding protein